MRVAYFPGCVAKGNCPELNQAIQKIAPLLGIELVELTGAPCTGAGVLQAQNPVLADTYNAKTLALAEELESTTNDNLFDLHRLFTQEQSETVRGRGLPGQRSTRCSSPVDTSIMAV